MYDNDDVRKTAVKYFAHQSGRSVPLDLLLGYLSNYHEHGDDELPRVLSKDLEEWALQPSVSVIDMRRSENLRFHISGLQAALTQRNERIAQLEAQIAGEGADERERRALERAHRKGWEACAEHVMASTDQLVRELGKVRKGAWQAYMHTGDEASE